MAGYNNNRGGGGGSFQAKPRPVLPIEHALSPQLEACIEEKPAMRDFGARGPQPSRETLICNSDSTRASLPIPKVAMAAFMQFGVPLDHSGYPEIKKFDSRFDACHYYCVYNGPIVWQHNAEFRHIPGFTRYVVNKHAQVLNAYNGKQIVGENQWMLELVSDGTYNGTSRVPVKDLMGMAFSPLPDDFIDFGFRTYSHEYKLNLETGLTEWIARPGVKVKDASNGQVLALSCLPLVFKTLKVPFDDMKEWNQHVRNGLKGETITIGDLTVKEDGDFVAPPAIPVIEGAATETASVETELASNDFDTDIDF